MTYYPVGKIEFCRNYSLHMAFLLYITYLREESIQCRGAFYFSIPYTYHYLTNFMLARFEKKYVKTTLSQEKLLTRWFDEIFLGKWKFYSPYHSLENTVWSLRNFCITWEFFREINFIVKLFTKEVVFTEIFSKNRDTKIS